MKVYCDTNVYNRCFDEQDQLRIRLECTAIEGIYGLAEAGRLQLVWSFMLDYENSLNPREDRKDMYGYYFAIAGNISHGSSAYDAS